MQTELVNSIINNLRIEKSDVFAVGMIEDSLEGISPTKYKDFFNALMGDDHDYLKPLDRVAKVAKVFKASKTDELFKDTYIMAKQFYQKAYAVNGQITDYTQSNRDKVPNDRDFFEGLEYNHLKDKHSADVFSKQDLYILSELGGGEWIMNIKFIANSKEAIEKIETIIKNAIVTKYMIPKHEAIASNIRKVLK